MGEGRWVGVGRRRGRFRRLCWGFGRVRVGTSRQVVDRGWVGWRRGDRLVYRLPLFGESIMVKLVRLAGFGEGREMA